MKTSVVALGAALLMALPGTAVAHSGSHVTTSIYSVGGSGVHGVDTLRQLKPSGTAIRVVAKGLQPGKPYLSLYYDNATCTIEPYSAEDVIGGPYTANAGGVGKTAGNADDDLDEIGSVSVREFVSLTDITQDQLVGCAQVGGHS